MLLNTLARLLTYYVCGWLRDLLDSRDPKLFLGANIYFLELLRVATDDGTKIAIPFFCDGYICIP